MTDNNDGYSTNPVHIDIRTAGLPPGTFTPTPSPRPNQTDERGQDTPPEQNK